jgi:hypothetical protein
MLFSPLNFEDWHHLGLFSKAFFLLDKEVPPSKVVDSLCTIWGFRQRISSSVAVFRLTPKCANVIKNKQLSRQLLQVIQLLKLLIKVYF